ncbi:MAG: secretion protein HlyD [Enterobacteriaceae bacterium]
MNKKKTVAIIVIALLLVSAIYAAVQYYRQKGEALTLYGNVDIRTVNLSFRVNGRLDSLRVDEGDPVKPGQLLGKLDDKPFRNALEQAQGQVALQKANLDLLLAGYRDEVIEQTRANVAQQEAAASYADSFYQRQLGLWKQKAVSANELQSAKSTRDQARATLRATRELLQQYLNGNRPQEIAQGRASLLAAQATLAQAKLDLQDTELRAPSPGTIMTRAVEPGAMLNANNTVFTLSLTRPVWIRAYVDEINLDRAVPGTTVQIFTDGRPDKPYHGTIGFVSPSAEFTPKSVETPELRTSLVYRLRLVVTDPDEHLRQGMPVTLVFP